MKYLSKLSFLLIFFVTLQQNLFCEVSIEGQTKTGYLLGGYKIIGVHYQCKNQTIKTTDQNGAFDYNNTCSEITFSLNNKIILGRISTGKIPNDGRLYLTDFVGTSRIDTNSSYVTNLSRLLQTLDTDKNPENGLEINSSLITQSISIDQYTTPTTLQDIVNFQYLTPDNNRTLRSEICSLVHLEQALRDNGEVVDNVPPCKPTLKYTVKATANKETCIEINGERNTKILVQKTFINANNEKTIFSRYDSGLTLDQNGKIEEFCLATPLVRLSLYDFNISLQDDTNKISETTNLPIFCDTDQPIFNDTNTTFAMSSSTKIVSTFTVSDDSQVKGYNLTYTLSGDDKSLFKIDNNGKLEFIDYPPAISRTYFVRVIATDEANHYEYKDLNITVTP